MQGSQTGRWGFTSLWMLITTLILLFYGAKACAVDLFPGRPHVDLWKSLSYLAVEGDQLSLEQVLQRPFEPFPNPTPNFGFSDKTFWVRLDIENQGPSSGDWTLEYAFPLVDQLTFYLVQSNHIVKVYYTGDTLPFDSRPLPHRNFLFPFHLSPGDPSQVFLKIKSRDTMQVPVKLFGPQELFASRHVEQFGLGAFFGVSLVMILFNFSIFFYQSG